MHLLETVWVLISDGEAISVQTSRHEEPVGTGEQRQPQPAELRPLP